MSLAAAGRYLRTIRHLRPRQMGSQVVHRLRRERSGPRRAPAPERMPEIRWADDVTVPAPPRAHNTVEIEGQNQVEVWAAFRVGRRCAPRDVDWQELPDGFRLSARHDGYRHLPGRPMHARTFRWHAGGQLDIADAVEATRSVRSVARLHFHPDCRIRELGDAACTVTTPDGAVRVSWSGWAAVAEDDSIYCPRFGVEIANPCLRLSNAVARLRASIRITAP